MAPSIAFAEHDLTAELLRWALGVLGTSITGCIAYMLIETVRIRREMNKGFNRIYTAFERMSGRLDSAEKTIAIDHPKVGELYHDYQLRMRFGKHERTDA